MLTVDDYGRIRRAHRDGMSIREIARTFNHSRRKVREVLRGSGEPTKYRTRSSQPAPKLGPLHGVILEILQEDENSPPKQRHTAQRIFERLRDEHGYEGSYCTVRRFISKHRQQQKETFIPLDHQPGQRMEADFGEIAVDFPEGRQKVNVLILVSAAMYSDNAGDRELDPRGHSFWDEQRRQFPERRSPHDRHTP